jgi:type I restriction enzyme S subunit
MVIGMDGDFRISRWSGPAALLNQRVCKLTVRAAERVDDQFLLYLLPAYLEAIHERTSAVTVKHLSSRDILEIPVPIPPLEEQHRIVAWIEAHASRLERSDGLLRANARRIGQYRSAVLQRALRGDLLVGNERPAGVADPQALPSGWTWALLNDLAVVSSGSTPKAGDPTYYEDGTVPWVTSGDLNDDFVRTPRQFVTERALNDYRLKTLPPETLLVAMYGEGKTRGKCSELLFAATTNQACAAIAFREGASIFRPWVKLFFAASYEANRRLASGGVQPNLSGRIIKSLRIPLPPVESQRQILVEVDRQLAAAARLGNACNAAIVRGNTLRSAILRAAFTGSLVLTSERSHDAPVLLSSAS